MSTTRPNMLQTSYSFIRNLSLTVKVAGTASLMFIVFVFWLSYVSFTHFESEFKDSIYSQQSTLVKALAKNIDDKLRITLSALTASAQMIAPEILSDADKAQSFLDSQHALHSLFDTGLFLIDKNGKLIAESPFRPNRRGRDLSVRDYFKGSERSWQPYISKPYPSTRSNHEPALRMSSPIFDSKGEFAGILAGRLDLLGSNILAQVSEVKNGTNGYLFMTDGDGLMIMHPKKNRLLTDARGANPLYDRALAGFEGTDVMTNSYGIEMIMTYQRLKTTHWLLASNYPKQEADAPFRRARHLISATLAIGLILLIIVLSALMRGLTKPLTEFTNHLSTLANKPDAERFFPQNASAEFSILAGSFNNMITTLAEHRKQLQCHQEQLELLVQERTTDLQEAQQIGHIGNWKRVLHNNAIYWSDEIYRILGYEPSQCNPSYERLLAARHYDDAEKLQQPEQTALEQGNQHSVDYRIILPDSSIRWVHEEVRAERNASGHIISLSGTLQDISERKQVEQALIESREAAEAASRAKSLFLSSMSHELRTPLNAVLGFAHLLATDNKASEETHSYAREIELAGRHLLALVSDLLDLARIESGRIDVSIENIDPMLVLAECQSLLNTSANARRLSWNLPTHMPPLQADRIRLRQIFLNLLSNAIKYNRDGGKITVSGQSNSNHHYRISITDTGQGIPPDRIEELFQPFNRIGAERSDIEGSGIGLVITKNLVTAMHGQIGMESTFSTGSTFWFELPMVQTIPHPVRKEAGQVCILAAEDHEPNRRLLRLQIEKLGFQVEFACNGNEALLMWQTNQYQLLLTDCNMPVMDGYELSKAVRQQEAATGEHIPIVALTANSDKEAVKACMSAGMDDFLMKPVHLSQLQNTLHKWIASSSPPSPVTQIAQIAQIANNENQPAYDDYLQNLADMLGDANVEQASQMLLDFLRSAEECLQEAHLALEAPRNAATFVRAVHKLKSSARMIGATALSDICQRAEQAGLRDNWVFMERELPDLVNALQETRERIHALPEPSPPSNSATKLPINHELAQLRLMLVDDDPFIINYLTRLLSSHGVTEIETATEGNAALTKLTQEALQIDVIVCDLNMPGMDGVEFLRHVTDAGYKGAIIIVSGNADLLPAIYELAQAHGLRILGTLAKPFMPQRFFDILTLQLGERRLARPHSAQPTVRPTDVAEGLLRGEFLPYFQPKVDAHTLRPYGAEALARWQRPDGTMVSPFAFIPLMEVHGLIDQLFITMLSQTLAGVKTLEKHDFGKLKVAVNLAASTLSTLNLPELIDRELEHYQIHPGQLILEITESGLMHDAKIGLDVLLRLRLRGIGLSIDDFGTGYSTITQLRRLPFTELKLDQSFVTSAAKNPASQIILESSLEMAHRLNLITVAEGVESEQDLAIIRRLGCDVAQGFLIAKPMPLNELIDWLHKHPGES